MAECIFCKIVKGEIPSAKIYEDDETYAFLDIAPVNPGHTLVIPKHHTEKLGSLSDKQLGHLMHSVNTITKAVEKGTKADATNVTLNNGEAAGQVVKHVHFHIIPRFKGDGLKPWQHGKYEEGEMKKVQEKIGKFIA
ncbi:MAG: HIT family protein [Nanoarchaeota archaeon]|nr:HIT family protein [Nanoarchaeota archaeon]